MENENEKDIKIEEIEVSDDFKKIITDFAKDLVGTFPDKIDENNYIFNIAKFNNINDSSIQLSYINIYEFCRQEYPKHFFMLLYQNNDFFKQESLYLLPDIDFIELWNQDLTETTRCTIWKYLQLILFTVVSDVKTEESFGDAAKLFEAINGDEFQNKMQETVKEMEELFRKAAEKQQKSYDEDNEDNEANEANESIPEENSRFNMPEPEKLHEHLNEMLGGKIGSLAKEIAEETADELNFDMNDNSSVNDIFQKLFKNPSKLMNLVKNVGSKLDNKIKSGDIKESELLEEASLFLNNMKNMPGMGNLENIFKKMGMPGGMAGMPGMPGMGGGKMDMNAMRQNMEANMKNAKMKERMRTKLEKKQNKESGVQNEINQSDISDILYNLESKGVNKSGKEEIVFTSGEQMEKTMVHAPNLPQEKSSNQNSNPKKKKNKNRAKKK